MVSVEVEGAGAGVVGRAEGIRIAIEPGLFLVVALEGPHCTRADGTVEAGLPFPDVDGSPRGLASRKILGAAGRCIAFVVEGMISLSRLFCTA